MRPQSVLLSLALLASGFKLPAQETKRGDLEMWEHSIVNLEVARKKYDYYQPWTRPTKRLQKIGTVVGERQILTTADEMFDSTLIRLQKGGRGRWCLGTISWIDYHANLALVTTSDPEFWRDLKPAALGTGIPQDGGMQIMRWREGNLETRRAEFLQFAVREGQLSPINSVVVEVGSEVQGTGWGEPLIANSHVAGILTAQDGRTCTAMPASFILGILEAHRKDGYRGLGYFHFYWQPAENPALLARLKLQGEPRGVVVTDVPPRPDGGEQVLKPLDIILRIDGFDLDIQGDYKDPEFGYVMLENLATRRKFAGDEVKIQIEREGKTMDISYRLPKYDYSNSLVPPADYDKEPEYLIVGGLVFQPLTEEYLQSWGTDWKRRAPFRLQFFREEGPTKERPALVLLSQVLPDAYNIGYQDQRYLVVDKVNGETISRVTQLPEALQHSTNGYHTIEFAKGETLRRMVLEAGGAEHEATQRVLKRYGIKQESHLASAER